MLVLVDTSVWSLVLRRKTGDLNAKEEALTQSLAELIRDGRAQLMGVVRLELLSEIREKIGSASFGITCASSTILGFDLADYEEAA